MPWWSHECFVVVQARRRLYHVFRSCPTQTNLLALKKQEALTRRTLKEAKRKSWVEYISTISSSTPVDCVWRKIRALRGINYSAAFSPLSIGDRIYTDHLDIANQLALFFAEISSDDTIPLQSRLFKREREQQLCVISDDGGASYNSPFTAYELSQALAKCSNTAPGPDTIPYQLIRQLPASYHTHLLSIYNQIWLDGQFPSSWHQALIVAIPKPGKNRTEPSSYRPISLTNCLCKIMERMVNSRLTYYLDYNSMALNIQCGARKGHSTIDNLTRVSTFIQDGFIQQKHTIGIFFDLEKAYDRAWSCNILTTLQQWGMKGPMYTFIRNFLEQRQISVRVGSKVSQPHILDNSTPQGSVLSCTLFAIAMQSISRFLPSDGLSSLFIDDFGVLFSSKCLADLQTKLNRALKSLEEWSIQYGFRFSPNKTKAIHFCKKRSCSSSPPLFLYNEPINYHPTCQFLGLTFDRKLTWVEHIKQLKTSCLNRLNLLKTVSRQSWGADRKTLLMMYRSLVRSRLDYGCEIYSSASSTVLATLDTVQSQALRLCLGAFRTSPVVSLNAESHEPPLRVRVRREQLALSIKLLRKNCLSAMACII